MVRNPIALDRSPEKWHAASQKTLRHAIGCVGVGRHTGARVAMTLHPAEAGSGIRFRRSDRSHAGTILASPDSIQASDVCAVLRGDHGEQVASVEHLMAALAICELDNVLIEVSGPELPAMDGSAQPFVFLIECAGFAEQTRQRAWLEVTRPVSVGAPGRRASLVPAEMPEFAIEMDSLLPPAGRYELELRFDGLSARQEIAPARDIVDVAELEELQARGLGRGCSLSNSVFIEQGQILNEEGLRFEDEAARHRLLDALGDLYLVGMPIIGRYVGERAGHRLNSRLLGRLLADAEAWRIGGDSDGRLTPHPTQDVLGPMAMQS